jgi:hypothetical protein
LKGKKKSYVWKRVAILQRKNHKKKRVTFGWGRLFFKGKNVTKNKKIMKKRIMVGWMRVGILQRNNRKKKRVTLGWGLRFFKEKEMNVNQEGRSTHNIEHKHTITITMTQWNPFLIAWVCVCVSFWSWLYFKTQVAE